MPPRPDVTLSATPSSLAVVGDSSMSGSPRTDFFLGIGGLPYGQGIYLAYGFDRRIVRSAFMVEADGGGRLYVDLQPPAQIGAGVRETSFEVRACYDSQCRDPVPEGLVAVQIRYEVFPVFVGGVDFEQTILAVDGNALAWDAVAGDLYVSANQVDGIPDAIAVVPAADKAVVATHALSATPHELAISADGSTLYAGLDGIGAVQRMALPDFSEDLRIYLGEYADRPVVARYLAVDPGHAHTVAVSTGAFVYPPDHGLQIFDDDVARPVATGFPEEPKGVDSIAWRPDGTRLYGNENDISNLSLYVVSPGPVVAQEQSVDYVFDIWYWSYGNNARLHYDSGLLISDDGTVIDEATYEVLATYPESSQAVSVGRAAPDVANGLVYLLYRTGLDPASTYTIRALDVHTMTTRRVFKVTATPGKTIAFAPFGTDGFAFLTDQAELILVTGVKPLATGSAEPAS